MDDHEIVQGGLVRLILVTVSPRRLVRYGNRFALRDRNVATRFPVSNHANFKTAMVNPVLVVYVMATLPASAPVATL